jgi:hypothetical protein
MADTHALGRINDLEGWIRFFYQPQKNGSAKAFKEWCKAGIMREKAWQDWYRAEKHEDIARGIRDTDLGHLGENPPLDMLVDESVQRHPPRNVKLSDGTTFWFSMSEHARLINSLKFAQKTLKEASDPSATWECTADKVRRDQAVKDGFKAEQADEFR